MDSYLNVSSCALCHRLEVSLAMAVAIVFAGSSGVAADVQDPVSGYVRLTYAFNHTYAFQNVELFDAQEWLLAMAGTYELTPSLALNGHLGLSLSRSYGHDGADEGARFRNAFLQADWTTFRTKRHFVVATAHVGAPLYDATPVEMTLGGALSYSVRPLTRTVAQVGAGWSYVGFDESDSAVIDCEAVPSRCTVAGSVASALGGSVHGGFLYAAFAHSPVPWVTVAAQYGIHQDVWPIWMPLALAVTPMSDPLKNQSVAVRSNGSASQYASGTFQTPPSDFHGTVFVFRLGRPGFGGTGAAALLDTAGEIDGPRRPQDLLDHFALLLTVSTYLSIKNSSGTTVPIFDYESDLHHRTAYGLAVQGNL